MHALSINDCEPCGACSIGCATQSCLMSRCAGELVKDLDRYDLPVHNHAAEDSSDTPRVGDLYNHLIVVSQGLKAKRRCCKTL